METDQAQLDRNSEKLVGLDRSSVDSEEEATQQGHLHHLSVSPIPDIPEPLPDIMPPASPSKVQRPSTDDFGFFKDSQDANNCVPLSPKQRKEYQRREAEWLDLLGDWDHAVVKKKLKIKNLCRLGIPDSLRARVWCHLCGAHKKIESSSHVYQKFVDSQETPTIFEVIERDINRCYPSNSS